MGFNDIKRIFDEYLDENYIEDEDIMDYIKEFDTDKDGKKLILGSLNKQEFINSFL